MREVSSADSPSCPMWSPPTVLVAGTPKQREINCLAVTNGPAPPGQQVMMPGHHQVTFHPRTLELGPNAHCPGDPSSVTACFPLTNDRKRTFYLLVALLVVGVAIMVLTVITATVIYVKHAEKLEFTRRPLIMRRNPCDSYECPFGGECLFDELRREPICRCRESCEDYRTSLASSSRTIGMVCGTDERTYVDECALQVASCKLETNIYVKHGGPCEQVTSSSNFQQKTKPANQEIVVQPKFDFGHYELTNSSRAHEACLNCSFGSICMETLSSSSKNSATSSHRECVCPEKCDSYLGDKATLETATGHLDTLDKVLDHDGHGAQMQAICGSDGRDYLNLCDLLRSACRARKNLRVKYIGSCDPCQGYSCPPLSVCRLEPSTRVPSCLCSEQACYDELVSLELQEDALGHGSTSIKGVCGSDGRSYRSECFLEAKSCRTGVQLRTISKGDCVQGQHPCHNFDCGGDSSTCSVDRQGIAACSCPPPCPKVLRPVCASNGLAYDSECHLQRQACLGQDNLTTVSLGQCPEASNNPCSGHVCPFGGRCEVNDQGQSTCVCPNCSKSQRPVCGSDGVTYTSECYVRRASCEGRTVLNVLHEGHCRGCEGAECTNYAHCELSEFGRPECVCPKVCIRVDSPVCGSDGLTYENDCELRVRACKLGLQVRVASRGPCDSCKSMSCGFGAICQQGRCVCPKECPDELSEAICANDGKTYKSECHMRRHSCHQELDLTPLFYGECEGANFGHRDRGSTGSGHLPPPGPSTTRPSSSRVVPGEDDDQVKFSGDGDPEDSEEGGEGDFDGAADKKTKKKTNLDGSSLFNFEEKEACDKVSCEAFGGSCQVNRLTGSPKCECDMSKCHEARSSNSPTSNFRGLETCGSDGRLYANECFLREESCRSRIKIDPVDRSSCPRLSGHSNSSGPSGHCLCNKHGSYATICDPATGLCPCRPGVGGSLCDRCEPAYYGLHKISEGTDGCLACLCHNWGSVRQDCEQMSGRCVCKHGVQGTKCDKCPRARVLTVHGCTDESISKPVVSTCSQMNCLFGAKCVEANKRAQCVCDSLCDPDSNSVLEPSNSAARLFRKKFERMAASSDEVCGSDGNTYANECHLKLYSCRIQESIVSLSLGPCKKRDIDLK